MNSFYIDCLGCKVNSYEIEAIKDELLANNFIQAENFKDADYIIINTCCVTNNAASKSRQKINSYHNGNVNAKIIVMGCYVQGFKDEVSKLDGVSLLIGTNNRKAIIEYMVHDLFDKQINLVEDIKNFTKYENLAITSCFENTRAYLKIQDGCNNFCSYCIIPYVRGIIKSRPSEEVIKEAKELVNKGYKEIVLTGIHTGSYGKDLDGFTFSDLVEKLLEIDGLYRLRISSIEESEIDEKLINLLISNPKLAKHLHMPLQAGSDHVLKLMNRKYDLKTYINKVEYIKSKVKDVAITTDIIVGFPQESEEDFQDLVDFVKEVRFDHLGVFTYSKEENTPAYSYKGTVNSKTAYLRRKEIMEIQQNISLELNKKRIKEVTQVLIEEFDGKNYYGRNYVFAPDAEDGQVIIKSKKPLIIGQFYFVEITGCTNYDLIGKIKEQVA